MGADSTRKRKRSASTGSNSRHGLRLAADSSAPWISASSVPSAFTRPRTSAAVTPRSPRPPGARCGRGRNRGAGPPRVIGGGSARRDLQFARGVRRGQGHDPPDRRWGPRPGWHTALCPGRGWRGASGGGIWKLGRGVGGGQGALRCPRFSRSQGSSTMIVASVNSAIVLLRIGKLAPVGSRPEGNCDISRCRAIKAYRSCERALLDRSVKSSQ